MTRAPLVATSVLGAALVAACASSADAVAPPAPAPTPLAMRLPVEPRPDSGSLGGAASKAAAERPRHLPATRFGDEVLAREPLLVVGVTRSVARLGIGTAVVRVEVEEHLHGDGPRAGEVAVVLAYDGDFHAGGRDLLVLEGFGGGGRYRPLYRIDARDDDFRAKVAMCRRQVELLDEPDTRARDDATVELLARSLAAPDAWTRQYALSEVRWIAAVHPEVLSAARLLRLRTVAAASSWPDVTDGVESVAIELSRRARALPTDDQQESSPP